MKRVWLLAFALCACQKEPKILTLSAEPPKIFATPTPAMTPPVRHVVARPQPTQAPEEVLDRIIEAGTIQDKRWAAAKVRPAYQIAVDKAVMLYLRTRDRYEAVAAMRSNGVPAPVVFCLHYRESSNSFRCHLHEGSSLSHRTRYVPKGRLPAPDEPPYEWQKSAEDAIYVCDHLQGPWKTVKWSLDKIEGYNGVGYRARGIPSPYLWAATTVYQSGKYTSDGHFSPSAIDAQLGVCAILKRMEEKGVSFTNSGQ